jgi:hypothetical protein
MRQKQVDSEKVEVDAASLKINQNFSSKFGMQWRSKVSVVNKRKECNTIFVKSDLQNCAKNISSISEIFQLFISNSAKQGSLISDTRTAIPG